MSLWDRYLAPGDIRARRVPPPPSPSSHPANDAPISPPQILEPPPRTRLDSASRRRRQNNLLYGGLTFTILSLIVTRRTLRRKRLHDTLPPMSLPPKSVTDTTVASVPEIAPYHGPRIHGPKDAAEAFGLATLNVFSMMMVAIGTGMRVFDIGDLEDLREKVGRKEKKFGHSDGGIEGAIEEMFEEKGKGGAGEGKTA